MPWHPLPLSYAVAVYPFQPSISSSAELPLQIGDQLYLIEQGGRDGSWYRGYLIAPPTLLSALSINLNGAPETRVFSGIFPRCCVEIREELGEGIPPLNEGDAQTKPPAPVPMLKIGDETTASSAEPLVDEISSCLREWYSLHLPAIVLNRQYDVLDELSVIMSQLDYARRQLLNDVLTAHERVELRKRAVWSLVRGNKMLGGEVIVRDPAYRGRLLTSEDSAIDLTRLQATMGAFDGPPVTKTETPTLHHLLFRLKSVACSDPANMSLTVGLYSKSTNGTLMPFSESYTVDSLSTSTPDAKLRTLFSDIATKDVVSASSLYLVVKVTRSEFPKSPPKLPSMETLSRNGTLKEKDQNSLLNRRRSSLMFGSKRHKPKISSPQLASPVLNEEIPQQKGRRNLITRAVSIGMTDLSAILRQDMEEERVIALWSPASEDDSHATGIEDGIRQLLHSPSGQYTKFVQAPHITVHLASFSALDPAQLIRTNPTSMHQIIRSQRIGFAEAPVSPRSDIYVSFQKALLPRGAQLSHPETGFTPLRPSPLLNLQLTMEVRDSSGRRLEHCIYPSSQSLGVTAFRTDAGDPDTAWNQTICLKIPAEILPQCHLIMSLADAPEFPFALAWMPLWDKQAFVQDGPHSLILHAYDKTTSSIVNGRGAYLSLPWDSAGNTFSPGHDGVTLSIATLDLETRLCSTEVSQDQIILQLINWRQLTSAQLIQILQRLAFVPEIEIVKQLNDVLDSLSAILVRKSGESKFEDLIFNDIVHVLAIVYDRRFNIQPLVEQYTETRFNFPFAAPCLLRSFTRLLQSVSDPQSARDLRALFKVGQQFIKLLITSHQQSGRSASEGSFKSYKTFKEDMQAIFFGLQMMLRSPTPALVGSKTLFVQHFHSWIPELLVAFTKDEVIKIVINFIDASQEATGKLVLYRILLILNCAQVEDLWAEPEDREVLIKSCMRWLAPYWGTTLEMSDQWREQVRLCCSVLAELVTHPTTSLHAFMPKVVASYETIMSTSGEATKKRSLSRLFSKSYPFTSRPTTSTEQFDETLLELSGIMSMVSIIPPPPSIGLHGSDLNLYILAILDVQQSIIDCDAYPRTWLSLHIYHHRSLLVILTYIASILVQTFLPVPEQAEDFDMELWKAYFSTLLKLVTSEALALETFPEQKRRAVWKIAGDVREAGASLLRQSWEAVGWEATADDQRRYNLKRLGGYQVQYVPSLVLPIMELCLSMHEGLRRVAVEILQSMIVSEWALSEDLSLLETEMIGSLDAILKSKSINESITRRLFINELLDLFETIAEQPDDALWIALKETLATIDELIDLLIAANGDVSDPTNTLRLMEFMKDMQKEDIFIRYVHELAQDYEAKGSPTNAARAIQQHADLYPWDVMKKLPALEKPNFPEETAFIRKERLYLQMIHLFENGNGWLQALKCYKELAEQYELNGDFAKLARAQRAMARINENRASSMKQQQQYQQPPPPPPPGINGEIPIIHSRGNSNTANQI